MGERLAGRFIQHHQLVAVAGVLVLTHVLELLLLQRKYDLLTGGFLQPYSYITFSQRAAFIGLSLWVDLFFFGLIGSLWAWTSNRFGRNPLVASYNLFAFGVIVVGLWLAIQFKVLAYFNDTLNFIIIRNLGGGSLMEAFAYVSNEAVVFGLALAVIAIGYGYGLRAVKRFPRPAMSRNVRLSLSPVAMVSLFLLTVGMMVVTNANAHLRYGLAKKTSYNLISRFLDTLTDIDGDNHGLFSYPLDAAPLDGKIYPGALDIPGNGIDENGYGGDFAVSDPELDRLTDLEARKGKHIGLIVLESARADMIGKRVEGKDVAPVITAIADKGTAVAYAYSHTGYTTSSIKAIFNRTLSDKKDRISMIDFLEASGYQLSFISGQDESFGDVANDVGMNRRDAYLFDARSDLDERVFSSAAPGSLRLSEERIVEQFKRRVDEIDWSVPQFIYVNVQAAHFPYSHPKMQRRITDSPIPRSEIASENHEWLAKTYWNAIASADWAVGEMVAYLKAKQVYDHTVLAILGDHGESLFDDEFLGHGHALNETQTRIPLVFNQSGLRLAQAIGQSEVGEIAIRAALGLESTIGFTDKRHGVFQLVGSLSHPQLIGLVQYGERRTVLDLRIRKIYFSDLQRWIEFDAVNEDPELGRRVRLLVEQWERLRWQNHIATFRPH